MISDGGPLPHALQPALGTLVTSALRDMITNGRFAPGEHLKESDLASALKVSRGPVREALTQLEAEGHVELRRHRGAFVALLTRTDIEEVHTLRKVIEQLAAEQACLRLEGAGLAALDAVLEDMRHVDTTEGPDAAVRADLRFHDVIYDFCDHTRVQRVWESIRGQVTVFLRARNVAFPDFKEVGYAEHKELRDALAAADPQVARDAIDKHIRGAYERLRRLNLPERRPEI